MIFNLLFFTTLVWGMRLLRDFFHEKLHICVFFDHILIFPHFFELKKTRIEISRRLVKFSGRELRYLTISCIFGWCRYQNNPRLSWSLITQNYPKQAPRVCFAWGWPFFTNTGPSVKVDKLDFPNPNLL